MRHRLSNNSLSRPTAHRLMMLRNLVSSLLQHERITTTVAKAKETQKLAEKVIGWGKKGGKSNIGRANAFLLNPKQTLPLLFSTLSTRYASRSGGYTRLHLSGHRVGDHAPTAVLELVDNPSDLKFDSTARAVGRELAIKAREAGEESGKTTWSRFRTSVEGGKEEEVVKRLAAWEGLDEKTRKNVGKVLAFRSAESVEVGLEKEKEVKEEGEDGATPEADESSPTLLLEPSTQFLNLAHTYYLRQLAIFTLAPSSPSSSLLSTPTSSVPLSLPLHPTRQIKQLTQRLSSREGKEPPKEVLTVPVSKGRGVWAGERLDGFALGEEGRKVGGPISRAKGETGRWERRVEEVRKREGRSEL